MECWKLRWGKRAFFILTQIVADEKLLQSFSVHMLECAKQIDMDQFYEESALLDDEVDEKYGYFITKFTFDVPSYLKDNAEELEKQYQQMKHLLN